MVYAVDPRVDDYIDALPDWQQAICQQVRELVHAADPAVAETIKFKVRPYFVLEGNVCALLAAKDHVNVFLYDGAIVPDPAGIITAGHDNTTARTVAFRRGEPINADALTAIDRNGEILDVGRSRRDPTPGQRKAVIARDQLRRLRRRRQPLPHPPHHLVAPPRHH